MLLDIETRRYGAVEEFGNDCTDCILVLLLLLLQLFRGRCCY